MYIYNHILGSAVVRPVVLVAVVIVVVVVVVVEKKLWALTLHGQAAAGFLKNDWDVKG